LEPVPLKEPKSLSVIGLLKPHWKGMMLALAAVAIESATELLDPWPLKLVLDYLLSRTNGCPTG
jgi:hypothetical protein